MCFNSILVKQSIINTHQQPENVWLHQPNFRVYCNNLIFGSTPLHCKLQTKHQQCDHSKRVPHAVDDSAMTHCTSLTDYLGFHQGWACAVTSVFRGTVFVYLPLNSTLYPAGCFPGHRTAESPYEVSAFPVFCPKLPAFLFLFFL